MLNVRVLIVIIGSYDFVINKAVKIVKKKTSVQTNTGFFLTFRDHLHIFVGQSSPSFFFIVLSVLLFPGTTMSIICLDMFSSSLLLMCPYQFSLFCLRYVGILHTLASSLYDLVSDMVFSGLTPYSS